MRGPKSAPITIQVFADFQCPFPGTPTFLFGDEIVNGAVPFATFEAAIRHQKAMLKSPHPPIY